MFPEQGTSFRAELLRVRTARAADLLQSGAAPMATVARAVGYRQPARFSKAFRRHHGRPPSEIRAGPIAWRPSAASSNKLARRG